MSTRVPLSDADRKRLVTAIARCALVGVTLHHTEGDFVEHLYVATRWSMTLQFTDLDSVERWLDLVGGTRKLEGSA